MWPSKFQVPFRPAQLNSFVIRIFANTEEDSAIGVGEDPYGNNIKKNEKKCKKM